MTYGDTTAAGQSHGGAPGIARTPARRAIGILVLAISLTACLALSLLLGAKQIELRAVIDALLGTADEGDTYIVMQARLPRAVLGVMTGTALGLAGGLIQAFTRNPLADPGILGVNAGAAFAVTIGVAFVGVTSITGYVWFAFAGAAAATLIVYSLGSLGRAAASPVRLTLVGVAIGALLGGITSGITLLNPTAFDDMRDWGAGSLSGRGWDLVAGVAPFILVGTVLALAISGSLNAVALGDELASSLGAHVARTRAISIIAVTLLAGAATAAVGPIGFVGLMVPHVCRWVVGPDQRWILLYSVLAAPILVTVADVLGRVVVAPQEVQTGIITALVGAPVLVALARRAKVSGL
jgi:iron complex transport system permease protein